MQMQVTTLEHSSYVGKIAIGKLRRRHDANWAEHSAHILADGTTIPAKVSRLYRFRDLKRVEIDEAEAGAIVAVAGIEDVGIGDTLADPADPPPLPPINVEEPTVRMTFSVNDSPFAGRGWQVSDQSSSS